MNKKTRGGQHGNTNSVKADKPATARLNCRVIPEDKEQWTKAAEQSGLSLTDWVIKTLNSA